MLSITRSSRPFAIAGALVLVASLAACGHNRSAPQPQYSGGYQTPAPAYPSNPQGTEYGRVSNIEVLQGRAQGQTSGGGAILGAVVGGILGNQVGKGSGRAAATAVGVLGVLLLATPSKAAIAAASLRRATACRFSWIMAATVCTT